MSSTPPLFAGTSAPQLRVPLHPRVVCILNGKGGVGKTSIAANTAGQMARDGLRVLIIDLDPQEGSQALELGLMGRDPGDPLATDNGAELYESVRKEATPRPICGVRESPPPEPGTAGGRLDVLAGGPELEALAVAMVSWRGQGDDDRLARTISRAAWGSDPDRPEGYDIILLDCPPGYPLIQEAALRASRYLVVPAKSDSGSRLGLTTVATRFQAAAAVNPQLVMLGVVLFAVNFTARATIREARKEMIADLSDGEEPSDAVKELIFPAMIRSVEAASRKARKNGLLVFELLDLAAEDRSLHVDSTAGLASDYDALAHQIVERILAHEGAPQ